MLNTALTQDYVFAGRDRMDAVPDYVRAVRDQRFKYIRNYQADLPYFRPLVFRDMFPVMQSLWQGKSAGTLTEDQRFYFAAPRPREELYDTARDPQEVVNLANQPGHAQTLQRLRDAMDTWITRVGDKSSEDASRMIETMWPGGQQPVTQAPVIEMRYQRVLITSATPGASIAYRFEEHGFAAKLFRDSGAWQLYRQPIPTATLGQAVIVAKAVRYGYAESLEATFAIAEVD